MQRKGRGSFSFEDPPVILGYAAAVGKKESEGPLGGSFDKEFSDNLLGEDSWEKAESGLLKEAVNICVEKCGCEAGDFDVIFSGDLLNQCIASAFGLRAVGIPHIGMYGACSTMASSLINAAVFTGSGGAKKAVAATSSHFSSSERQFRNPLQYGGQRTPTAQWTVTGAGAIALGGESDFGGEGRMVRITGATIGTIEDLGVTDVNNMGAAMAPAAAEAIKRFLADHGRRAKDYDLIMTGDLGYVGSELLLELLAKENIDISENHCDGGKMIYSRKEQDVHAGGSGCGCSAAVLCANILPRLAAGEIDRALFVGTGALMSPTSSFQGESLPSVAHAVELQA